MSADNSGALGRWTSPHRRLGYLGYTNIDSRVGALAMDAAGFCSLVLREFPTLRKDFDEWNDLIHVQVGEFLLFTQRAIEARSFETVSKCFEIADAALTMGDDFLRNAIYVSFLESLDFRSEAGKCAFQLMPAGLKKGHEEMLDYPSKLFGRKLAPDDR